MNTETIAGLLSFRSTPISTLYHQGKLYVLTFRLSYLQFVCLNVNLYIVKAYQYI